MVVCQVTGSLVCSSRIDGLKHSVFRVVRDAVGKLQAATDPVGAREGDWVFLTTGTAARFATGDYEILTDLTICGVIDQWPEMGEGSREVATNSIDHMKRGEGDSHG